MGGSTLDLSVLHIGHGVLELVATGGDRHLGGDDVDRRLLQHFVELLYLKHGVDLSKQPLAVSKLQHALEKGKRGLSYMQQVTVEVDSLWETADGAHNLVETLTRTTFDQITENIFNATALHLAALSERTGLYKNEINDVVLTGGSTKFLRLQRLVRDFFSGKELIHGNTQDETTTYGAGLIGARMSGQEQRTDSCCVEVTALSLGIETVGGRMTVIVGRNSPLPSTSAQVFSLGQIPSFMRDNCSTDPSIVPFHIYTGDRTHTVDNFLLDSLHLTAVPAGSTQFNVTFEVDEGYKAHVIVEDISTGQSADLNASVRGLSSTEIEANLKAAEEHHQDTISSIWQKAVQQC